MFPKTSLPVYFFGDNANQEDKLVSNECDLLGDIHASEPNLSRISSPASSLTSMKKLEWDSGADIGYSNAYKSFKKSRKSKSFPSLNMDLSVSQIDKCGDTLTTIEATPSTSKSKLPHERKHKNIFTHSTPHEDKTKSSKSNESVRDECLQTTLVHICSKSVQTDSDMIEIDPKVSKSQQTDTIKPYSSSSGSLISKSGSFQYIPCSNSDKSESRVSNLESTNSELTKAVSKASNELSNSSKSSKSSNTSPLGKIIATQQSTHLITDIDKSLEILNKFIKSKNYNTDTKRHYARKIVNKIITSKYSDDSNSTINKSSEDFNSKSIEYDAETNVKSKSQSDENSSKKSCKTPETLSEKSFPSEKKNNRSIKNDVKTSKNKFLVNKIEEIIYKNEKFTENAKNKGKSDKDLSSWKTSETLSEKLFEARRKSLQSSRTDVATPKEKSDYIIQHSRNEKKRQLSWINNEISYLNKLRELLQKHDTSTNNSSSVKQDSRSKSTSKTPENANSIKSSSILAESKINSDYSDIESRFYQEFGSISSTSPQVSESLEKLKKLSRFLTTDQIKSLIENDSKTHHCPTCECCKNNESKSYNSFDSHRYNLNAKSTEAAIQCTLKKKKPRTSETTTEYAPDLNNVNILHKNTFSDSTPSTEYEEIKKTKQSFVQASKKDKENHFSNSKSKPVAYFLTFEEESMKDYLNGSLRPPLKNITVKIPKLGKSSKKSAQQIEEKVHISSDGDNNFQTDQKSLQEYLSTNRPDFVKSANWRRKIISDQTERKSRNIFTCAQMKKQTSEKYQKLPEVQNKKKLYKYMSEKTHNRCMARNFAKKLQKKTLKGEISIATCINVMSPDS